MTANANKIKQCRALQQICIDRMSDIAEIAEAAKTSVDLHSLFKSMCSHLENIYQDFEKHNAVLLPLLISVDEYDNEEFKVLSRGFYKHYYAAKSTFSQLFNTVDVVNNPSPPEMSHVRLPKIELVKFDGNFKQWKTFIDMFNSLVHDNSSLKNIDKFNYLISSLSGSPLALVKCNPISDANYIVAYNSLIKRYENKRLLANAHYLELENAPRIPDNNISSQNLRKLVDTFTENIAALKNLGFPTDQWSFLLFNMLVRRLDSNTVGRFEIEIGSDDIPTFDDLRDFVLKQSSALDRTFDCTQKKIPKPDIKARTHLQNSSSNFTPRRSFHAQVKQVICSVCDGNHHIYKCPQFISLNVKDRFNMVKTKRWCFNCLGSRHVIKDCTSKSHCLNCGQTHHTLLHFGITAPPINQLHQDQSSSLPPVGDNLPQNQASSAFTNIKPSTHSQCQPSNMNTTILLSTALIEVLDARGDYQQIRALLDSGSQINIISQSCCNRLGLYNQNHNISLSIQGINDMNSSASKAVSLQIRPCTSPKPLIKLNAIVMPKVCNKMPSHDLNVTSWSHLSNLKLADPHFNISNEIDLLLGAEIFSLILNSGRRPGKHNEPNAFHTIFGWILMGSIPNPSSSELLTSLHCSCNPYLDSTLKRFWELEEVPRICKSSPEDSVCEDIFSKTVSRTASGRYIVSLPFRANAPIFSNSLELALRRFHLLELKLNRNPSLKEQYSEFMRDYLSQHHMSLITETYNNSDEYFIPHHCVLRPESATTKLRVVFDASAKTTSGVSLNDTLLIGPKLQSDLVTLLLNFRINPIALMVDIRQMYRQILLSIQHRKYQKILWRFSPNEPVQKYVLNTVTYGVSSAPFLAIRTLLQLAQDEGEEFPLAVKAIKTSSYVDDIVTSCQSVQEAQSLKSQLISLLRRGGFELHKWKSNHTSLLAQEVSDNSTSLDLNNDSTVKVLGLQWNASADHFSFTICSKSVPCSKRNILSEIARIFDPLGFLSPLTLFAKRLIQHLWTLGIGWDENPPSEVTCIWNRIKDELPILSNISVPRFLFHTSSFSCTLHGFADASEHGYAAVIYCRYETMDDIRVSLICAKSKVSPLKTLSIPKLELSAACLLADLLFFVIKIFDKQIPVSNIFAWSDSSTTLSWIRSSPHKWKTFVSNRVSRIQDKLSPEVWHYVPSKDNPADCASRGLFPSQLIDHSQWWAGPSWLRQPSTFWPSMVSSAELDAEYLLEEKRTVLSTQRESNFLDILLEKYSSFTKIQRIVAYVKRFLHNCQLPPSERKLSYLTFEDLHHASLSLVKHIQSHVFHSEISSLLSGKVLEKSLRKLNLFLDTNGLLRVGGRLTHSKLTYDKRHPLLLPSKHRLTDLIIESVHCQYFHPGFQTLYFLLLQKYWILSAKRTIRKKLSKCLTCWKQNPIPSRAPMGNLPPLRVSQMKPFSCIGIDFGGPYSITLGRHRGAKTHNAYICLFVCFATKALHLELATDLTSETFLAALRRLIARRGRVTKIFSDNGTNFIGASRILKGFHIAAQQELIEWSFIPPSSPHFGGLWEAGIKSVKNHISRVLGKQLLTYEEFNTLLVQVESVLNSRPLCPISSDPNDLSVLTPGHFLTLEPLNASPDEELGKVTLNRLSRWQLIQHLHKDFWSRWSKEYLHTLFQRGKWTDPTVNIELGTMVLIKHDSMPPSRWQLGRVVEVYPGTDGIIRVASVKTPTGLLKRSVVKLCPLPLENNQ